MVVLHGISTRPANLLEYFVQPGLSVKIVIISWTFSAILSQEFLLSNFLEVLQNVERDLVETANDVIEKGLILKEASYDPEKRILGNHYPGLIVEIAERGNKENKLLDEALKKVMQSGSYVTIDNQKPGIWHNIKYGTLYAGSEPIWIETISPFQSVYTFKFFPLIEDMEIFMMNYQEVRQLNTH